MSIFFLEKKCPKDYFQELLKVENQLVLVSFFQQKKSSTVFYLHSQDGGGGILAVLDGDDGLAGYAYMGGQFLLGQAAEGAVQYHVFLHGCHSYR